ncbi:Crp/Fnr family transcriptional regulator, partial [Dysosmobacter welbionis]
VDREWNRMETSLFDPLAGGFLGLDLLHSILVREVDTALLVNVGDLHPHHVAHLAGVLHLLDPVVRQLGDVDQSVLAGGQLHEGAEGHQPHHAAVVQRAHLRDEHNVVNALLGGVAAGGVHAGDEDGAVVVDVDLGAGVGHDLLDNLAAGADDLPDLGGINVHGQHLGRVLADLLAGLGDGGQHDLVQDLAPGVIGDVQGLLDDLHGEAV